MGQSTVENTANYTIQYISGSSGISIDSISYNTSTYKASITISYSNTDGSEQYYIKPSSSITDSAGNPLTPTDSNYYFATEAMNITINNIVEDDYYKGTFSCTGSASLSSINIAGLNWKLDSDTYDDMITIWPALPCNSTDWEFVLETALYDDGQHTLYIRGIDEMAIQSITNVNFYIDNSNPSVMISLPMPNEYISEIYNFECNAFDNFEVDTVEIQIGALPSVEAIYNALSYEWNYEFDTTVLSEGMYNCALTANDFAGNTCSDDVDVIIDQYAPSCVINDPADSTEISGQYLITGNAIDAGGIDHVEIIFNGEPAVSANGTENWDYTLDTTFYTNNTYSLTARAYDNLGKTNDHTINVIINN